jgi:ribosomal protein S18 acetylase RimI-like enzyme
MSIEIRSPKTDLEWKDYYDLRYRILRKPLNQAIGSEKTTEDETGIHFALYEENQLKAIARLDINENSRAQVRFVAVDTELQGKGFGKKLMLHVEEYCKQQGIEKIELQARENAVDFYLSLDYVLVEKTHLLFGLVQHYLMTKEILK